MCVTRFVRPDRVIATGVIQPFPIRVEGPDANAAAVMQSFNVVRPGAPTPTGFADCCTDCVEPPVVPAVKVQGGYEPQPEEVAMAANRLAHAMQQGLRPEGVVDPKLMYAARLIMAGQPFVIKSAGRAAVVRTANSKKSVANLIK